MLFKKNATIVLQGDSITDAGRNTPGANGLGRGYAAMCIESLQALYPDYELTLYNRGISGDRVENLVSRWSRDCLDLKPNLVSIFIGINNVWHPYTNPEIRYNIEKFETDYVKIVEQTVHSGAKLVIIEPFAFHHGSFPEKWREHLWQVNQVTRRIAMRYADAYIPLDGIMHEVSLAAEPVALSADGVHPTYDGHRVIAKHWLQAVGVL